MTETDTRLKCVGYTGLAISCAWLGLAVQHALFLRSNWQVVNLTKGAMYQHFGILIGMSIAMFCIILNYSLTLKTEKTQLNSTIFVLRGIPFLSGFILIPLVPLQIIALCVFRYSWGRKFDLAATVILFITIFLSVIGFGCFAISEIQRDTKSKHVPFTELECDKFIAVINRLFFNFVKEISLSNNTLKRCNISIAHLDNNHPNTILLANILELLLRAGGLEPTNVEFAILDKGPRREAEKRVIPSNDQSKIFYPLLFRKKNTAPKETSLTTGKIIDPHFLHSWFKCLYVELEDIKNPDGTKSETISAVRLLREDPEITMSEEDLEINIAKIRAARMINGAGAEMASLNLTSTRTAEVMAGVANVLVGR